MSILKDIRSGRSFTRYLIFFHHAFSVVTTVPGWMGRLFVIFLYDSLKNIVFLRISLSFFLSDLFLKLKGRNSFLKIYIFFCRKRVRDREGVLFLHRFRSYCILIDCLHIEYQLLLFNLVAEDACSGASGIDVFISLLFLHYW